MKLMKLLQVNAVIVLKKLDLILIKLIQMVDVLKKDKGPIKRQSINSSKQQDQQQDQQDSECGYHKLVMWQLMDPETRNPVERTADLRDADERTYSRIWALIDAEYRKTCRSRGDVQE